MDGEAKRCPFCGGCLYAPAAGWMFWTCDCGAAIPSRFVANAHHTGYATPSNTTLGGIMDTESSRRIAELEGKVRELEERWANVPWWGIITAWHVANAQDSNAMMDELINWVAAHHPERGKDYIEITATSDFVWPSANAPKEAAE